MKTSLLIISGCLLLMTGCKSKPAETVISDEESALPLILSLEQVDKTNHRELLSSLNPEIHYVALETTDQSLLREIFKIVTLSNGNFLITDNQTIHLFSPNGKHPGPVSQHGNGPADYTRIRSLAANPRTGGFFVHTHNKTIEFDAEGNYISNHQTPDRPLDMVLDADGHLIYHRMNVPKAPEDTVPTWFLYRYDTSGNELKRYQDMSPRPKGKDIIPLVVPSRPLYMYNQKVRFNEFGNDTIFTVEADSLRPYAILHLGEMRMPASPEAAEGQMDAVYAELQKKLFLQTLTEDHYYLYMSFGWGFGGEALYVTYNKHTGQVGNYGNGGLFSLPKEGMINDVDGGISFFPQFIEADGTRLMAISADSFREIILETEHDNALTQSNTSKRLTELAQSLDDDANPILMIVKNKK